MLCVWIDSHMYYYHSSAVAGFVEFLLQGCVKYLEEDLSLNVVLIPALTLGFSIVQVRENIPRIQF